MNKIKYGSILAITILVVFALSHSVPKKDSSAQGTIKIGSISALTGVGAAIGEEERKGAQLAVNEINTSGGIEGRKLELVSEDVSLDKIKNAATVAEKLVNVDNVVAIVGPQWDEPAAPILPIVERAKVPMIGADNSDQLEKDTQYDYFFSTWYDNRVGVRELLRFSQSKGYKNIAIIRPLSAGFWEFTANTFIDEAPKYGVNVIENIDMGNPLSVDFRTSISKIKAKKPDAVFIVTSDYNQCAFVKQAKELGLIVPTLGTESSGDQVSLAQCPELLENRYFSTPKQSDKYAAFSASFKSTFGNIPKYPSAVTAYDAVYVIADALKKTDGKGGEALQKAIAETDRKGAALAEMKFNQKGFLFTPEDSFEMKTTKGGVFVDVN